MPAKVKVDANRAYDQLSSTLSNWGSRHGGMYKGTYSQCTKGTVGDIVNSGDGYNCVVIWDGAWSRKNIPTDSKYVGWKQIKCARPSDPMCVFGYTTFDVIFVPANLPPEVAPTFSIHTNRRGNDNWSWDGPNVTSSENGNRIHFYRK